MAQTYEQWKKSYESMNAKQQQQYNDLLKSKWADYIGNQYMNQYNNSNTVYTPSTTQKVTNPNVKPTYTYGDTGGAVNATQYTWTWTSGGGNFQYSSSINTSKLPSSMLFGSKAEQYESQNAGYLEKRNNAIANALYNEWKYDENSVRNYLSTFQDYRDYDTVGQNNTVTAIMKRMWSLINSQWGNNWYNNSANDLNSKLTSEIWNNYENAKKWYSDLMWWGANYPDNFREAVEWKLQKAYWISDLDEFKRRYPEQYESMYEALAAVEWVRNATDPNERQMLDGRLQWIIGSGVWAGSDWSKLSVLESSIMDKFKNPDQIKKDAQNVIKLQTEWKNTAEIASEMWIPEDQVQQLILLANWLDSKAWEYYQLKDDVAKDITEPYDTKMARLEEEKKIALDRANRNLERLKEDFDTNMDRQKAQNDINLHNADFLAWQYGYWMSRRWIEWLNYIATQAQQILDDLTKNYDRNSQEMADGIADIIRNWQRNNEDLMKASQDALTNAKNAFTSNMLAIQQQYGTVGLQAQQALANNVQSFIEQAETIYDNALTRQQQNLSNLITNVSNLNALAAQNLTLRQAKIQQFQSESMNLNRNQLQSLAQQLGMDQASYQDLVTYQAQAVANELNGYLPWSWVQFQDQIQSLLNQWYTPQQAMQSIMKSADFQAAQVAAAGSGDNRAMSNGIMYNKATGEYQNLNTATDERWSAGSGTIYNKATGEVKTVSWKTVSTTNSDTWAYQRVKLDETPNEDTWIPNVYGSTVKLAPTVWAMLNEAYNALAAQWIELKIWDSYRSYESQKQAYESWKAWVVSPDKSYHVLWQAFDVVQDGSMYTDEVVQALLDAGFTRPNAKEPRHWSYWEWKDAFWWKPRNTSSYDLADAILNGVGTLPAKNSKEYTDVVTALNDRVKQIRWQGYPEWEELINYSVIFDNALWANEQQSIASTAGSIYSTDLLMKLLKDNEFKTWPIMNKIAWWNPRDADYAAINASINAMASNIARWFGEKWVLSDKDIERYMKTLPNTKIWTNAQEVVGTLLKAKLYSWLINVLETAAKNKRDVSMYIQNYQEAIQWLQQNGFKEWGGRWLQGTIDLSSYGRS